MSLPSDVTAFGCHCLRVLLPSGVTAFGCYCAALSGVVLSEAVLSGAVLSEAVLAGAALSGCDGWADGLPCSLPGSTSATQYASTLPSPPAAATSSARAGVVSCLARSFLFPARYALHNPANDAGTEADGLGCGEPGWGEPGWAEPGWDSPGCGEETGEPGVAGPVRGAFGGVCEAGAGCSGVGSTPVPAARASPPAAVAAATAAASLTPTSRIPKNLSPPRR
ncbi:pentapeptide repeat-containing protein [Hamadaea tsunoensis]|uniref:pentapeptide repeat-containing protein n=1 Tax=Hamadaea tsunoensis TaxID=53368 RepID=UPI003898F67C